MAAFNQLNLSYYFITTNETFEKMLLKINWPDNACRSNSTTYFWTASWKTSQSCSRTACLAQGREWSSTMALWVFSTFDKICPDSSVPLKNKFNWVLKFWKSKKWYPVGSFFFSLLSLRTQSSFVSCFHEASLISFLGLDWLKKGTWCCFKSNNIPYKYNYYDHVKRIFHRWLSISKLCGFGEHLVKVGWVSAHFQELKKAKTKFSAPTKFLHKKLQP